MMQNFVNIAEPQLRRKGRKNPKLKLNLRRKPRSQKSKKNLRKPKKKNLRNQKLLLKKRNLEGNGQLSLS
jgi:hypothetical protein